MYNPGEDNWWDRRVEIATDPGTSYWLRDAINALTVRDPGDALGDAEVLFHMMKDRFYAGLK